ncbi:hypothetical protein V1639_02075 [Pseudarthrobacter sp. J75]|uniref:hypothetical protein n=1 Tax=unclassified Pseudarthrobacter TaxID=2647000 RepID=UPI002E80108E|nr:MULTISPECIES: hypothetical protein [unclassified Pseudarthrobacter]MEE2521741.1 hypothetical protein [Pseudarthrobacter sp. J47]MEE2527818.1 hypothetical protein [Pseudarthrobacter sp. J75]MEE2569386.1 hypothetical protein [Pseudarthrobacter sp. J64]
MSSLFFWIIILSILIPFLMRWYRRSSQGRNQRYFGGPGQPGGPGNGQGFPGQQNQPRDGFTQQDYFAGGFRQLDRPRPLPGEPLPPVLPVPPMDQQFPPYGQPGYGQPGYGQPGYGQPGQQVPGQGEEPQRQPAAPATPPPPSAPQGYRARKLAELDAQYSNGELSMEDYMTRRSEIMNG